MTDTLRDLPSVVGSGSDEAFERLLDIPDWEIFAWLVGQEAVPEKHKGPVLDQLIGFRYAPRGG